MSAPASMTTLVDKTLGHFRVVAEIGRGGMGVVYVADDLKLARSVALKVLRDEVVRDANRRARFLREARAAAAVNHPNIAAVYEVGDSDDGVYLAMELVEGEPLRASLDGKPLPLERLLVVARGVAAALAKAHDKGVIHRDLKPENILITPEGDPKVVDFGLAKIARDDNEVVSGEAETVAPESREGVFVGTPAYASPEQARGLAVDHRSDLFSFGVVLYEMATGVRPFRGPTEMDVMVALLGDAPAAPRTSNPTCPEWLERVVLRCLAKDAAGRYPSAHEIARDLAAEAAARPAIAAAASAGAPPDRKSELILLERVKEFWIDGVLRHATKDEALHELGKDERLGVVDRGFELAAPRLDEDATPIAANVTIADYFDRRGAALLILGEPGSGKTVTLLQLASALVARAEVDASAPLPVVLSLATFADPKATIADFFVQQLRDGYRIPERVGRSWVESDRLALLLDGLDEVAPRLVAGCVDALNRFRDEHGLVAVAVASRKTDYEALDTRLKLGAAIQLRALSDAQIDGFVAAGGPRLARLGEVLAGDAELRDLAHSPLMLHIMSLSYAEDAPAGEGAASAPAAPIVDRRAALFDRYVDRMLKRREGRLGVAPARMLAGLGWLARDLKRQNANVFLLEQLQPTSLPRGRARLAYFVATRLVVAALFANLIGMNGSGPGFQIFVTAALVAPLVAFDYRLALKPPRAERRFHVKLFDFVTLLFTLAIFVAAVFVADVAIVTRHAPTGGDAAKGLFAGLLIGVPIAITLAWRRGRLAAGSDVRTVESLRLRRGRFAIVASLAVALPFALIWFPFREVSDPSVQTLDGDTLAPKNSVPLVAASAEIAADDRAALLVQGGTRPVEALDIDSGRFSETDLVGRVAIDPTGRYLATYQDGDGEIEIAAAATWGRRGVVELPSDVLRSQLGQVSFGRAGLLLASGERVSLLVDPKSGATVRRFDGFAAFASDDKHVIVIARDTGRVSVRTLDGAIAADLAFVGKPPQRWLIRQVDVDPTGRYIAASHGPCVYRIDLDKPAEAHPYPLTGCVGHAKPDPKLGAAELWFAKSGALLVIARKHELVFFDGSGRQRGRAATRADDVAMSADGKRVLVAAANDLVLYRDDATELARTLAVKKPAPWTVQGIRMSADGKRIVAFNAAPASLAIAAGIAFFGLLFAFGVSVEAGVVRLKTRVNEGIHRTRTRAIVIGVAMAIFVSVMTYLTNALLSRVASKADLFESLSVGLSMGCAFGLGFGGLDLIYHYVLRLILAARRELPLRATALLDGAVQLIVLRRVGGGYMFIHRLVLDHFAAQREAARPPPSPDG